jgi:alkylation response protein AidB-like acyl-CoA dehydrogenase
MEMIAGYQRQWDELRDFARTTKRNGSNLADDPGVRERLAKSYVDIQLFRLANLRLLTRYMRGDPPGAETSFMKLLWVDTEQRLNDLAMSLAGPAALASPDAPNAPGGGDVIRYYFMSRAASIYGGTQDIQRNVIAERVYGLPRG